MWSRRVIDMHTDPTNSEMVPTCECRLPRLLARRKCSWISPVVSKLPVTANVYQLSCRLKRRLTTVDGVYVTCAAREPFRAS
jgi:hypothetical protein